MKLLVTIFAFLFLVIFQFLSSNRHVENSREVIQMIDDFIQTIPSLPRYMEGGYSPLGRSPVVDTLLADPLYMPTYAESVIALIKENDQIATLTAALLHAGGIPLNPLDLKENLKTPPSKFLEAFTSSTAQKLYSYWLKFMQIQRQAETTLSVLTLEEKAWIKQNYNRFFFGDQKNEYDFFTSDNPYPLKFFELASRIDLSKLADCAIALSQIADDIYQNKDEFTLEKDFIWEEGALKLIVSNKSHGEHTEDADFFIDLGGHNKVYNNAGGTSGNRSLALHIDLKGNNTYDGKNFVQGSGFLGVGMLVNYSGNNTYHADSYSQGCGFFGSGFLVNFEAHNRFHMNFGGQSFALFGSSILWNRAGGNKYFANDMAQSASSTLGVAFLIENQGNNSFSTKIGQGGSSGIRGSPWLNNPSFYGGLSFLYLGGGNNKLKATWLAQGSAYFLGAGIVVSEGSNNVFEADYDAQGQGLHLAAGLVLNKGDHNSFNGGWGSLGVSGDRSIGMFINTGSHNHFLGTDQSIGSSRKPKSVGIFITRGNDNRFEFKNISNANIQYPQSPKEWSSALFLEIGKNSTYSEHVDDFIRGSGLQWGIGNHSLGISTESITEETIFAKFHKTPKIPFQDHTAYRPLITANPQELMTANYARRRQIYETLDLERFKDRKNDVDLSELLQNPSSMTEDAFNYAILWALRNKDKVDLNPIMTAISNKTIKSDYARKMAVSLVGTLWTPDAAPLLTEIMISDPSEEIRYFAALAIALHSPSSLKDLQSDSEFVRYAIAKGLQESSDPSALTIVIPLFNDESFYVRRAAGLTALSLGDKAGVPIVLETLQYETLDTTDNYGDNIFKQLSTYLGVDFGLDKDAWIQWWSEAKDE